MVNNVSSIRRPFDFHIIIRMLIKGIRRRPRANLSALCSFGMMDGYWKMTRDGRAGGRKWWRRLTVI
jgi:hypothetical protein